MPVGLRQREGLTNEANVQFLKLKGILLFLLEFHTDTASTHHNKIYLKVREKVECGTKWTAGSGFKSRLD